MHNIKEYLGVTCGTCTGAVHMNCNTHSKDRILCTSQGTCTEDMQIQFQCGTEHREVLE